MQKVELLAPAGNYEKLEIAIHFGADAVYLAGKDFSLRNLSGNFSLEEMEKAVTLAHRHHVSVYVTCNIYPRNDELRAIDAYLHQLGDIGPDALIIADPAVFELARKAAPQVPVHVSTQANTTSFGSARFWQKMGAERINTARELTLKEIKGISENCSVEIESFVHGAMCISHSGRCLLSSFMAGRDANRGLCCHPCRFRYTVEEALRPGQHYPVVEDQRGTYVFNSRDLCMIDHLPEMIDAGICSLKIEGRMKGINYVGSVVKTYRDAIDSYYENPEAYKVKPEWRRELSRVNRRGYCTGFYLGDPGQLMPAYEGPAQMTEQKIVGKVLEITSSGDALVQVRNKLFLDDALSLLSAEAFESRFVLKKMVDEENNPLPFAQPNSRVYIAVPAYCRPNDLLRRDVVSADVQNSAISEISYHL